MSDLAYKQAAMRDAANRLHHLSLRYCGAFVEVASGQEVGLLTKKHPGLREVRDLIDLLLFTRAEINALTKIILDAKLTTQGQITNQMTEEYKFFCEQKAKFLGVEVFDGGITLNPKPFEEK